MDPVAIITVCGAVVIALTVIGKAAVSVYRWIKKLETIHDESIQNPKDREEMHSFMVEMRDFKDDALHQLHPNSGTSINDKVTAIKTLLETHIGDPGAHDQS